MPSAEIFRFWAKTRAMLAEVPVDATTEPVEGWADRTLTAYRVIMNSFENIKIRAWYFLPNGTPPTGGWPAILELPSYTSRIVLPGYYARFGYATLNLFPRGQGESVHEWQLDQDVPKLLYNITDRERYYYRGAYMDCVRGLDFLDIRPEVDSGRMAVTGPSQGGGLTLATAALDDRPKAAIARLPWLCNFPEGAKWTGYPFSQLHDYLAEHPENRKAAMDTLSYFDNLNLADAITCPLLTCAAKKDSVHPYHTVMPVFEKIEALKRIMVYNDADDEEVGPCNVDFNRHALTWLERYLV